MDAESEGLCQECGKRKASIYMTDLINGKPVKKHICQQCYDAEEGVPALSSHELLAKLVGMIAPELKKAGRQKCPECGMDYIQFRQSLKFGCPNDYTVFSEALDELLEDMHGAGRHTGKIPEGRAQGLSGRGQRLEVLRRELAKAVGSEDFERAAQLKKKIELLEQAGVRNAKK